MLKRVSSPILCVSLAKYAYFFAGATLATRGYFWIYSYSPRLPLRVRCLARFSAMPSSALEKWLPFFARLCSIWAFFLQLRKRPSSHRIFSACVAVAATFISLLAIHPSPLGLFAAQELLLHKA